MPDGESPPKRKGKATSGHWCKLLRRGKITSKSWTHLIYLPWQQQPRTAAGLVRIHRFCHKAATGDTPPIYLHRCYTQSKIPIVALTQKSKLHMPERCLSCNQMSLVREVKGSLFPTFPTSPLYLSQPELYILEC